jgi:hypothetical protein
MGTLLLALLASQADYAVREKHPRIFARDLPELLRRVEGPLADDYRVVKERADRSLQASARELGGNGWNTPVDLLNLALACLVERAAGREHAKYADAVARFWGDGAVISNPRGSTFGFHALAYDWIFDALSADQRRRYGDALGTWLRWYTRRPEITLQNGHWEYNQTWGPSHLNVMHCRDGLTPKLFVALAIRGAGTAHEADAKSFLDSWHRRIPADCVPAFDVMGGVWSESMGHGSYGPVTVIPWAFRAWETATGIDLFKRSKPWGFTAELPRWVAHLTLPHNGKTAMIDDNDGGFPTAFVRAAPMLRDALSQHYAELGRDGSRERWYRVVGLDPSIRAVGPETLPLGYLFPGAGHLYARSAWKDPNATWAFFGAGPQFAGHSRDDEGHFMVYKKGALVGRAGGQGSNDEDHHVGGSLVYNIATIFDPKEEFRRNRANENDGGLLRHVYESGPFPRERGHMVAFEHLPDRTYAAADLTKGYHAGKAKEVTRQFLYLRGEREFFVVFDRVEATKAEYARHFFLHVPTEPKRAGRVASWLSLPESEGDRQVLSTGRARAFLHTLLPADAPVVVRGGPGKEAWGHPLEPTAQYNHEGSGRRRPPVCPWRLEAAAPADGARSLFLHVLEVADEGQTEPSEVRFVAPAGVDLAGRWQLRFSADGPLGGSVNGAALPTSLRTEAQYR